MPNPPNARILLMPVRAKQLAAPPLLAVQYYPKPGTCLELAQITIRITNQTAAETVIELTTDERKATPAHSRAA